MSVQLGRLTLPVTDGIQAAIDEFDCSSDGDDVSRNVCGFLKDGRFVPGIEHGFSATYLLADFDKVPPLLGYITLTLDAVRLTNSEKHVFGERPDTGGFGALRIQMIGVDTRHQGAGYGRMLLELVTGIAQRMELVPPRFVLADANRHKVDWYERNGFAVNRAARHQFTGEQAERVISMRLDLKPKPVERLTTAAAIFDQAA